MKGDRWSVMVASLIRAGFGVEDIAIKMGCAVCAVRLEIKIIREEGRMMQVLGLEGETPQ